MRSVMILEALQVSNDATPYINRDILPLPPARRTWTKKVFCFFWLSTAINIAEWSGASASLGLGLTVPQAIIVNAISTLIITLGLVLNGMGGGKWHVPFAMLNRAAWGIRGSWFPLLNRIILSCCWYGVEGWYGGQITKVMIGAIWPSFYDLKNTFGQNQPMQTNDFVSFMIFWVICLPMFLLHLEHYQIPALLSSVAVTVAAFALFIWALAKQGNGGPLFTNPEEIEGIGKLNPGSMLGWVMVHCITSGIGGWAGGILYQSDFSCYAINPGDQMWGQILIIPICLLGSNVWGIVTTSAAQGFYLADEPLLWKLYDLLHAIQTHEGPAACAAIFFMAFAFFISQLCIGIIACGIVGGMDLAALVPK
ncbi:permease for cytosine/purines, uracil, thiamine, allantoin-domain-containing protein [Gymnopilus junonius]|uniref:Permease for cytosine/purines, uracil, thiamine, allantoin-domain-containing protein n=1 Tax=Gymnopilus junonius TaxID=109634 RepID=A0A9P5NNX2_GYMJU|nr:permease for cytosine/purines, uracil, thiamine, allantoin-domain-containing protein [Gymnopilus junonius]